MNIHIIGLMNTKQPDAYVFTPMWLAEEKKVQYPSFSQSTQDVAPQLKPLSGAHAPNTRDVSDIAALTD